MTAITITPPWQSIDLISSNMMIARIRHINKVTEMANWIKENAKDVKYTKDYTWEFTHDEDLVAFKLRFSL